MGPSIRAGHFGVAQQTVQNGVVCGGQLEFQFPTHIYHLNGNIIHGFRKLYKFFPEKFPLRFPDKTLAPCVLKSGQIVRQRGGSAFSAHRRGEELMKKSGSQQLLAKQRLPRASVRLHGLGECLLLLGSGFLTAGAQIGGLALPLGACLTASLPFGRRSLSAALGAAAGLCPVVRAWPWRPSASR